MEFQNIKISPDRLLLDPNNYRFHDLEGYKTVSMHERYAELGVQQRATQFLTTTAAFDIDGLKDSIRSNGYVPLEQLVVEEYDEDYKGKRYLVLEGNRRAVAVLSLLKEHEGGAVDLDQVVLDSLKELPALLIKGPEEERMAYRQTIMAIRHIGGIREWGAYQQAKLVVQLYEIEGNQFGKVSERIGISAVEVGRRYRASKALQQMEEDDEFSQYANPRLYVFFHEAVSQPKVREWLGFSDETFRAENPDAKRSFYELLSPREVDGKTIPPKLENANRQVRQLKDIVDKPVPLKILLDPEKPFADAVDAATQETIEEKIGVLEHSLSLIAKALNSPGIDAWSNPSPRSKELWSQILKSIENLSRIMPKE